MKLRYVEKFESPKEKQVRVYTTIDPNGRTSSVNLTDGTYHRCIGYLTELGTLCLRPLNDEMSANLMSITDGYITIEREKETR